MYLCTSLCVYLSFTFSFYAYLRTAQRTDVSLNRSFLRKCHDKLNYAIFMCCFIGYILTFKIKLGFKKFENN